MAMRTIDSKDLDISNIPDERIEAINQSIAKGKKRTARVSPYVGVRKVRVRAAAKRK